MDVRRKVYVFRKERIQVICNELLKLSKVQEVDITDWKVKEVHIKL